MKRYWIIWMAFLVAGISAKSQEVSADLEHDQIKIGEQTTLTFEIRVPASAKSIMLPELRDTISKFVEIIDVSEIDTTFDEDDITTKIFTQTITVTSWDSGYHVIPAFVFVIDSDTMETKPTLLSVQTIQIQADQDIKDIKKIIEVPFSLWDWIVSNRLLIGIVLLVIIIIIIAVIVYKRYQNRPVPEQLVVVPKEAADLVAKRKLEELNKKKLWQNNKIKEYHSELSFVVREYIENRFHLRALEQTTDEIILLIQKVPEVKQELHDQLYQLLFLADMAKYAKQKPLASENEEAFKNALNFVEQTALKAKEEDEDAQELLTVQKEEHA